MHWFAVRYDQIRDLWELSFCLAFTPIVIEAFHSIDAGWWTALRVVLSGIWAVLLVVFVLAFVAQRRERRAATTAR